MLFSKPDVCRVVLIDHSDLQLQYLPQSIIDSVGPQAVHLFVKNTIKAAKVPDMPHEPLPGTP